MTDKDDCSGPLHDELANDPFEVLELAAADVTMGAQGLLERAVMSRKDMTQRELAEALKVTEGRVSQVLGGEGISNLALLGRYMRALGYEIELTARPANGSVPQINEVSRPAARPGRVLEPAARPERETRPTATSVHVYKQIFASSLGVYTGVSLVDCSEDLGKLTPMGMAKIAGKYELTPSGKEIFTTPVVEVSHEDVFEPEHVTAGRS